MSSRVLDKRQWFVAWNSLVNRLTVSANLESDRNDQVPALWRTIINGHIVSLPKPLQKNTPVVKVFIFQNESMIHTTFPQFLVSIQAFLCRNSIRSQKNIPYIPQVLAGTRKQSGEPNISTRSSTPALPPILSWKQYHLAFYTDEQRDQRMYILAPPRSQCLFSLFRGYCLLVEREKSEYVYESDQQLNRRVIRSPHGPRHCCLKAGTVFLFPRNLVRKLLFDGFFFPW